MILSIATLWHKDYEVQSWQQWLVYCGLIWLSISLNVFGSRFIPLFNQMIFVLSVLTLSATTIVLLVYSRHRYPSGSWVSGDTTNSTGWPNDGFAFILCIGNAVYAYLSSDGGAHLYEEMPNPGRNVPKVMLYPLAMGLITAFPFTCACMASIVDLEAALNTATGKSNPMVFEVCSYSILRRSSHRDLLLRNCFSSRCFHVTGSLHICFFGCLTTNGLTNPNPNPLLQSIN